ncbi:hypothetical protein TRFO_09646 [Tritrichomonas foetus]|uniref:Uncharacterized protein n=1 Tax=Tritrichomonas foetus TaxID=1144522 RepID=A0A1J4JFM5_9EUKA|nr:hypothetical protein TRFO_09646 [Tritrichomonas foetus]|eukprot:OHS97087.1 hypothetical protein TRFO_09646 [Tritrichomonas foetus]
MSWFKRKSPAVIVKKADDALKVYSTTQDAKAKSDALEAINKNFGRMNEILYKKKEGEEASNRALQLVNEISHCDFIMDGLDNMLELPVEQRKQFSNIFTGAIAHQTGSEFPVAIWVQRNPRALDTLLGFYNHPELAVCAGDMLRLCVRHVALANQLLQPERLDRLFGFFSVLNFDVSADSFCTFHDLILNSEDYLIANSQSIIDRLHGTLDETKYAACRQSLKLIGEIIISFRKFQDIYLTNQQNLITIMKLMSSAYKNIQMEAFDVFKLFVAREQKPEPILKILRANSEKLIKFIHDLLDGVEDQEVQNEKDYLLTQLGLLQTSPPV